MLKQNLYQFFNFNNCLRKIEITRHFLTPPRLISKIASSE